MGSHEITLAQFMRFYREADYKLDSERDGKPDIGYNEFGQLIRSMEFRPWNTFWKRNPKAPVVFVSWNDAVAFCKWLSKKEGKVYRLPTEAEWEYAARAGSATRYSFGDNPEDLVKYENVADADMADELEGKTIDIRRDRRIGTETVLFPFLKQHDGYVWVAPVGQFRPNSFGLYDTQGNVAEWCADWFDANYYANSPTDDPCGPQKGAVRVCRGGGMFIYPAALRCAARSGLWPSSRHYGIGFRIVCERSVGEANDTK